MGGAYIERPASCSLPIHLHECISRKDLEIRAWIIWGCQQNKYRDSDRLTSVQMFIDRKRNGERDGEREDKEEREQKTEREREIESKKRE